MNAKDKKIVSQIVEMFVKDTLHRKTGTYF